MLLRARTRMTRRSRAASTSSREDECRLALLTFVIDVASLVRRLQGLYCSRQFGRPRTQASVVAPPEAQRRQITTVHADPERAMNTRAFVIIELFERSTYSVSFSPGYQRNVEFSKTNLE
jgi:hypothetical protein